MAVHKKCRYCSGSARPAVTAATSVHLIYSSMFVCLFYKATSENPNKSPSESACETR